MDRRRARHARRRRYAPRCRSLYAVYGALKNARDARGALDFRGGEVKARIGDNGTIEGFYAVTRNDAHRLIEECMIAANVEAAVALAHGQGRQPVPSSRPARGQARHRAAESAARALQVGATFSEKPTPREFRQLVERLAARPDGLMLEGLVIRSLAQAVYQQTNIGHFGLGAGGVRTLHLADTPLSRTCWCIAH